MRTWIFQANPDRFDIDGYLATSPPIIQWLARQNARQMGEGDQVFIWRAQGSGDAKLSGIVAEAYIASLPRINEDDAESHPFWRTELPSAEMRARLRLVRIELKDRFQRNWLDHDPVMSGAAILKLRAGTNFLLKDEEAARLNALWRRAKAGWTYAEVVAGMWAYKRTLGGQISRLPGSPVATAALRSGRVMQGMYNKVQHFRSMDPNDPREGLTSNSVIDRQVWARFFDPVARQLLFDEIEAEFERFWPDEAVKPLPPRAAADAEAAALSHLTLAELLARYARGSRGRPRQPRTYRSAATVFDRDPLVVAIAKVRANHRCEVPGCEHQLFLTSAGVAFVEVHHIEFLADGGPDTPENVACVCPSHHREAHHGSAAAGLRESLQRLRAHATISGLTNPGMFSPAGS
jgi:hypothetical protein